MEDGFNVALGGRLRAARRRRGFSLNDVERLSEQEFKASVLGAYERGERALSVHRLWRLASLYGVPTAQLIPPDPTATLDGTGSPAIDIDTVADLEQGDVVERFLSAIQLMRSGDSTSRAVRQSDVAILTSMLQSLSESSPK